MKITNKFNLPETFMNVIHRPTYSKGDSHISATELLNSPRIVQLKHKHWEEIEQDASEMVWQLFGSAVHGILEHGRDEHHIVEQRVFLEYNGWKISGAIDLQEVYEDGISIRDYKVTSAWAVMNEKADWHNQLNTYAWLLEMVKGVTIKDLAIIAIIRDWSAREALTKEGYPQSPIVTIDIPLWPMDKREEYVNARLTTHNDAYFAANTDGTLPECTPDEMWEKPTTYAIKKDGGVRAKSVHKTKEDAESAYLALKSPKDYIIETREGGRTRCEKFCQVAPFCEQYKTYLKGKDHDQN